VKPRAVAEGTLAHSVHLEVTGLEPATAYYYRFVARNYESRGRTKTAPEPTAEVPTMAFAFANCQSWQGGLYPTYRHMAQDGELDLVVHLGDYIYESGPAPGGPRMYETAAPTDLASFRNRHAEYKTDPDLQAAHAAHPWVVTWDDHEVENDYAGTHSWYDQPAFAERRAAAYQAYYEHMPLRPSWALAGQQWGNINLYRRLTYGRLAQFCILDIRQYRSVQPCGDELVACEDRFKDSIVDENGEPRRHTILGPDDAQESWLKGVLASNGPLWNIVASGVLMFEYDHRYPAGSESYYLDGWDGYVATRNRLFEHLLQSRVPNPIVLSGDLHASFVADLKYHPDDPNNSFKRGDSITIGGEFLGTSISSGLSASWIETYQNALSANPHVKYFDGRQGGYVRCDFNSDRFHADFLLASSLSSRLSPMRTIASFEVYPEADPNLRKGPVLIYRESSISSNLIRWVGLAAVVAGALLIIGALIALFTS
jgi:alkaline phosphatase D